MCSSVGLDGVLGYSVVVAPEYDRELPGYEGEVERVLVAGAQAPRDLWDGKQVLRLHGFHDRSPKSGKSFCAIRAAQS